MTAGVMTVLGVVVALLAVWLLVMALAATVRNDGYGQRPPPSRLGADTWQQ